MLNDPAADAWQAIATAIGQSGGHERASALTAASADVACRAAALTALASVLTQTAGEGAAGAHASALDLVTATFDAGLRVIPDDPFAPTPANPVTDFEPWRWALLLADAGRNAARLDDQAGAIAAFARARRAAGMNPFLATRSWALTHIALRLAQAGDEAAALEVARQAGQAANRLSDGGPTPPWRWQLTDRVAQALAASGHLDDAVRVVDGIENRRWQCIAAFDVVDAAAEVSGPDRGLAALVAMLSDLPGLSRERAFGAVIRCAPMIEAQGASLLREVCDRVIEVERWWL